MSKFQGHEIRDWSHYRTPRTISNFHVDRGERADKMVIRAALLIGAFLVAGVLAGVV